MGNQSEKQRDMLYLCGIIGSLAGIPIRVFQGEEQIFYYAQTPLPKDPMELYREEIFRVTAPVGYITTDSYACYGILNAGDRKVVLGPSRQIAETEQQLRELAFRLDVSGEELPAFLYGMKSIVHMPMESLLQILCALYYGCTGEKLSLSEVLLYEPQVQERMREQERQRMERKEERKGLGETPPVGEHNTLGQEQTILRIVRKGDSAALQGWIASAPAVSGGILAHEQLRQLKNTFIVTITLVSRAAIRGGMDANDAFALSDYYIQQCELLQTPETIANLQYRMILDYTQRVERLRLGKQPTKLSVDVANYVQHHLSEPITTEQIAAALYLSRPYLSRKFREETGETLTDFILKEKTEEAKRLLRYSDKSLTAISNYLGFSSPSHFSRVFRKYSGCIPREYREKYSEGT